MKRIILSTILISMCALCRGNDSLNILSLQREVIGMKATISRLQQENSGLRDLYQRQAKEMDSLKSIQKQQAKDVGALAERIGADISDAKQRIDNKVNTLSDSIKSRTWLGLLGLSIAIALLGVVYYMLSKKISIGVSTVDNIHSAQEKLEAAQKAMQEDTVKLDNKLLELLDKQVNQQPKAINSEQPDHSLAIKVADEIVRIKTNLSRMDQTVRGYKQLARAVEHISTNFLANGYEIVEMLGKPYNEGMRAVANFVNDETLAEGEQIITGIIKPQINYNGTMIQSAQITVSQNL